MNKKESLSEIKRENEFIQTLFNFVHFQEKNFAGQINIILSFIQNSKNGPNYFIQLIDNCSLCRPQYRDIWKLFVKCIFFCFPETTEQNKSFIKQQTEVLKDIVFPNEFQHKSKTSTTKNYGFGSSQKNEEFTKKTNVLFSLIQNDDGTSLDSFLKSNPEFNIQVPQSIDEDNKYYPFINRFNKSNQGIYIVQST